MIETQPTGTVTDEELAALRDHAAADLPAYLADLERLVNVDSGSYTKTGIDHIARWTGRFLAGLGAYVAYRTDATHGETVLAIFRRADRAPGATRALLIGHMDTVFGEGTAAARPFRVEGGRAYGPGVADMKCGILAGLYALRALRVLGAGAGGTAGWLPFARLAFVANPDEEIGSPVSGEVIREAARESDVAFVLESARANGDVVSARKGVVDLELRIRGRAAHAGIEPEKGRSAILEAAHLTIALHALPERFPGVTCNVGVVRGGSRPNVVAEEASLEVDLRATDRAALEAAEAELRRLCGQATVPGVTCEVVERARHWPMEKSAATAALAERLAGLADRLGFSVRDAATGGASDANTTAGMGVPTLDGLGPIGGNDHSPDEYLELDSIVPRVTLLAAMLLATGRSAAVAPPPAEDS